ncbi:hypothetical protein ISS30_01725 [bacterium]|nr:hypothetical protein [FCB group bacterium]MBL7190385.1 hypothetical protein [bacterium]
MNDTESQLLSEIRTLSGRFEEFSRSVDKQLDQIHRKLDNNGLIERIARHDAQLKIIGAGIVILTGVAAAQIISAVF